MSLRLPLVFWNGPPQYTITTCIITDNVPRVIAGTRSGTCIMWKYDHKLDLPSEAHETDVFAAGKSLDHEGDFLSSSDSFRKTNAAELCCEPFAIMRGHETAVTAITECKYDMVTSAASISSDGSLYIWGLQDGRCMSAANYLLRGTPTSITALPGGNYVACGGRNNEIEIVDLACLKVVRKIEGHSEWISGLACGAMLNNTVLLSVSNDATLRYWIFEGSGATRPLPGYTVDAYSNTPLSVARASDWSSVLVVSSSKWHVFTYQGYKPLLSLPAPENTFLSGGDYLDNRHIIIYGTDGSAYIYRLPSLPPANIPSSPVAAVNSVSTLTTPSSSMHPSHERSSTVDMSPDTRRLSGQPAMRKSISTTALGLLGAFGFGKTHDVQKTMVSPSGVATASPAEAKTLRPSPSQPSLSLSIEIPEHHHHEDSGEGSFGAHSFDSVAAAIEMAKSTSIFDLESAALSPTKTTSSPAPESPVTTPLPELVRAIPAVEDTTAWHSSGSKLVRATSDGKIIIWNFNPHNKKALEEAASENIHEAWCKAEGVQPVKITASHFAVEKNSAPRLVQGFSDGSITVHPGVEGERPLHIKAHRKRVTCLLVAKRASRPVLISGSADFSIKVWDMADGSLLKTFNLHSSTVSSVFRPPKVIRKRLQNCFCSLGEDRSVVIYSLKTLERIHLLGGHSSTIVAVYWRVDLDYLLVRCMDGAVYVWQLSTGMLERRITGATAADLIERSEGPGTSRRKAPRMLSVNTSATHSSEESKKGFFESVSIPVNDEEPDIQLLMLSIRRLIAYIYSESKQIEKAAKDSERYPLPSGLKSALGYLMQHGEHESIQTLLERLDIKPPTVPSHIGVKGYCIKLLFSPLYPLLTCGINSAQNAFTVIVPRMNEKLHPFMFSPVMSALTILSCISVLSALASIDILRTICQQCAEYYLTILPREVQPFEEPSYLWCSQYLKESFRDIQAASNAVMRSTISRLPPSQISKLSDTLAVYRTVFNQ